ncbi:MAG: AmmeMemoRadiSam system protein B [Gammaproteobacteria bacterium]|nr:AmmeMemoRadiSam system protein B [Gammaproteobacteria bacterium]NNM00759.1 AmmeMemoRadiSam system protein B [Gammaproteobacteria bacterium]
MTVRDPAVAGMFYPEASNVLRHDVQALLSAATGAAGAPPRALIVPHAGYVYSGATAAAAYHRLAPLRDTIRRVALFGPAHRVYVEGMAVPAADAFQTPLGEVPLDRPALARLATMPGVAVSDLAHRDEHSLEVHLPFLQSVLSEFSLVPVVVGRCSREQVAAAMEAVWNDPATLLVVSSDLSHYHSYDEARAIDRATCERICDRSVTLRVEEACGGAVINGLFSTELGRTLDIELIDLRNSGDTAGDKDRVVGYGAFALH